MLCKFVLCLVYKCQLLSFYDLIGCVNFVYNFLDAVQGYESYMLISLIAGLKHTKGFF